MRVVAISGGPDSMALLFHSAMTLGPNNVIAVYLDHGLRDQHERHNDRTVIASLCHRLGVRLICRQIPVALESKRTGDGIEAAGRVWRYKMLAHLARLNHAEDIATAHHLADSAETVLYKIVRGSGTGLAPIRSRIVYNGIPIVRPFLDKTKSELIDMCVDNQIEYSTDSTNSESTYSRNRIRNHVMPHLRQINSNIDFELIRFANRVQTLADCVRSLVPPDAIRHENRLIIVTEKLSQYHVAIQQLIILDCLKVADVEPSANRIDRILRLLDRDPCPQIQLDQNWYVDHRKGTLRFIPVS